MNHQNYLWKFHWDCGRAGEIEGLFIATEQEVESIVGQGVYFGEVLGKHSEVRRTIDPGEITKVEVNSATVDELFKVCGSTVCGYNPLEYLEEEEEE